MPPKKKSRTSKAQPKTTSAVKATRATTKKASKAERKLFPFLDLPSELREQIYVEYVRAAFIEAVPRFIRHEYLGNRVPIRYYASSKDILRRYTLALSLVNHQTYAEILPVIFQEVAPVFQLTHYLPLGKDGKTPGALCDKATNEQLPGFNHDLRSDVCITKLEMSYLAKFNTFELWINTGPGFMEGRDYLAVLETLQRFRAAIIKESETRTNPMHLEFRWTHYTPKDEALPLLDNILRSQKLDATWTTLGWQFKFLGKVKFGWRGEVYRDWEFEEDEEPNEDPEDTRKWYWMTNDWEDKRGYAVLDVVDDHESDITIDPDEMDPFDGLPELENDREYNSEGELLHEYDSDGNTIHDDSDELPPQDAHGDGDMAMS